MPNDGLPDALALPCGEWLPITTATRTEDDEAGEAIPCCWEGREGWAMLRWKFNRRTGLRYFGDPWEWDDYDMPADQPTHWLKLPEVPGVCEAVEAERREQDDRKRSVECPRIFDAPGLLHD